MASTHLFMAKDVASPSDVLEQREDLDNAGSRCKHPLFNKGMEWPEFVSSWSRFY